MAFVVVACVVMALAHAVAALLWLPEPELEPGEAGKTPYRSLLTWPRIVGFAVVASLAALTIPLVDAHLRPAWFVYCSAVLVLVWVDLQTTYLPSLLHWVCVAELVVALALARPGWGVAGRALVAALVTAGLFWLVWRFSGTFGYGDVRLGLIVGGVPALWGWAHWYQSLFVAVFIGAVWAVVAALKARRRDAIFPYGPAMWLGPVVMGIIATSS